MKAIILAAGRGSRLEEITAHQPKCLTMLGEKTLLHRQIDTLNAGGITDLAIVRGYKKEKIDCLNIKYFDNDDWNKTNMVMSLYKASEWLEKYECIISYSDIVYTHKAIELLKEDTNDIALLYNTNWYELWNMRFKDPLSDAETFKIDKDNFLLEIGKKTKSLKDIEGQYMGLLKFKPQGWKKIKSYLDTLSEEEKNKLDMTSLLNRLLSIGMKIHTIPYDDLWLEVDNKNDLELYEKCISEQEIRLE
ncbi:phosphocholine cytidylyltransferase family protein [Clostridium sp. MB40-C1]|uniref:phosphocholine cytidylyltransferase family protein n=1 Tax=Clostridium sp. MB40-C1 TaxID=3070996 RepID=UPI0027DF9030|nr:phosphocholine cytidylyltransferase family protein [Clostridium sp. MB40-C1]WMJ81322.1 phosphocholine cytidylyltransferase family protein [Clostridium sp. MB40-C1]